MIQGGYFFISSEVGSDVCSAALLEIYKEIEILKTTIVPEDELQVVKNYMLGSFLKGIDGAFNLADRWKGIMHYNLGYDYFDNFIKTVKGISSSDILQLAHQDAAHRRKLAQRHHAHQPSVSRRPGRCGCPGSSC